MTQYTADALSAPHSQREIGMIEDSKVQKMHIAAADDLISREAKDDLEALCAKYVSSFKLASQAYDKGFRNGRKEAIRALPSAQPTAEVERLRGIIAGQTANAVQYADCVSALTDRAEKAEAALAARALDVADIGTEVNSLSRQLAAMTENAKALASCAQYQLMPGYSLHPMLEAQLAAHNKLMEGK